MDDSDRTGASTPRCTARSSRTGERCRKAPVKGSDVCATHGASAPQVRAAAARRLAAQAAVADARAVLAHEGLTGVADPVEALARLASEADAFRGALARRVNGLEQVRFTDERGGEQLRAEVALYERALDRTARFVGELAKLDLAGWAARREQERLELDRALVRLLAAALTPVLDLLGAEGELRLRAVELYVAEVERRQAIEGVA